MTNYHLELTPEEMQVLRLLIDFHQSNDEPDEYYPDAPFQTLRAKVEADEPEPQ